MVSSEALLPCYRIYDHVLATSFRLRPPLPVGAPPPDIVFHVEGRAPFSSDSWRHAAHQRSSITRQPDGRPFWELWQLGGAECLRFTGEADYYIWPDRIICHPHPGYTHSLIELDLLGRVLSHWLERRDVPNLHAAGIVVDGEAILLLAGNGGGKTSLALEWMRQGAALLSDDVVPLVWSGSAIRAFPGYPQLRLWPDAARHFFDADAAFDRVHPKLEKRRIPIAPEWGQFHNTPVPVRAILLPERVSPPERVSQPDEPLVTLTPIGGHQAVLSLVALSFSGALFDTSLQGRRMQFYARMTSAVPLYRLTYRDGYQWLSDVVAELQRALF